MRLLLAVVTLALLAPAACSSTCRDGSSGTGIGIGPVSYSSSGYKACKDECCQPVDPKECRCSNACPCWRKHR